MKKAQVQKVISNNRLATNRNFVTLCKIGSLFLSLWWYCQLIRQRLVGSLNKNILRSLFLTHDC